MKVTFKTGSEVNYGSTNGEMFFASDTKQLLLNGVKYIPKKLSELTNDSGFLTSITKSMVENVLTGNVTSHTHTTLSLLSVGTKNTPIYLSGGTPTAVSTIKESLLTYGEDTSDGNVSALDMATFPLFCTNRLAFGNPDGVTVEYSRDGGTTWLDYNKSDSDKVRLISNIETPCFVGGSNTSLTVTTDCKLRITLNAKKIGVYTRPKKLFIKYTTFGVQNSTVLVEYAKLGSPTNFTILDTYYLGADGWRSIPIGRLMTFGGSDTQINNNSVIRLTINLGTLSSTQNNRSFVRSIMLFGETDWTVPSNTATNGFLYAWDNEQNAIFPAKITSTAFVKSGSSNSYILLGAGGTKALSELALASDLSKYLPLTGGTLTGSLTCNGSWIEKSGSSGSNGFVGYFNTPKRSDRAGSSHIFNSGWAYGANAISLGASAYAGIRNTDDDSGTYQYLHWQWMDCLQVKKTTSGTAVNCYGAILTNAGGNKDSATFSLCIDDMCVAYGMDGNSEELNNFLSFTNTNASTGRVVVYIADNKSGDTNERIFAGTTSRPRSQSNVKIGNVLLGQGCNITDIASMSVNGVTVYRVAFYFWNKTLSSSYDITKKTTAMVCTKVNNANYSGASSYASGYSSVASGAYSVASGYSSVASGAYSVASGSSSVASGAYSVASGAYSVASGSSSVASGYSSVASGSSSVASGSYSVASSYYSVASSYYSVASGYSSVASGAYSVASGSSSVAKHEGSKVYALRGVSGTDYQTVLGRDNVETSGAVVVGWGSSGTNRKNIFVLDTNGNATFGSGGTASITAATFNGNATSATKLVTPRKITIGSTYTSFDGSSDIEFKLGNIITQSDTINVGTLNVASDATINGALTVSGDISGELPNKLSITLGSTTTTYDNTDNKSINITPSAIGAAAASHTHTFASLTSKPTTLSGYGITDAYTKTETNTELDKYLPKTGGTLDGALTVPKLTSTGGIVLGDSSLSAMVGSIGIQRYDETGFIGFLKELNLDNSFNGVVLGWDGNYSLQGNSVRIDASTFTYKGYSVLHSGNLGYISSGLSRAVQKDASGNLFIVAPSLFEQGISNNYPKNLRWSNETEGQLVYDTEETAGNTTTVEVSIPVANGTSKGFLKSTSTITNVTGYTPCPVVSGTPYYKEDCLYLGSTEIGYTGIMEYGIQYTFNYGTKLPYLEDYTPDSIPRCVVLCFPDRSSNYRFLFWLSAFDEGDPYIARFYNSAYETWLTIDTASRQIILSYGNTWQS